jgi:hypothetical protein
MRTAIRALRTALPNTDPRLIGSFLANLLDLWEASQKLEWELQKLSKLRLPRDQETLRSVLIWIDAIQIDLASFWIGEVKRDLPRLLKAMDKLERRSSSINRKNGRMAHSSRSL